MGSDLDAPGATAALAGAYSFCCAMCFLVYGPLSDHLGRRRVLVSGLALLALLTLVTIAVGLAPSMTVLGICRAIQGAAAATFAPTALAYLAEALPPRRHAAAIGAISVAFLAAGILGQLAAVAISTAAGWRWTFFLSDIALAAAALASAVVIREPDVARPRQLLLGRYASLIRFTIRPRSAGTSSHSPRPASASSPESPSSCRA